MNRSGFFHLLFPVPDEEKKTFEEVVSTAGARATHYEEVVNHFRSTLHAATHTRRAYH